MSDISPDSVDLRILPDIQQAMVDHCLTEKPLECCGILAGRHGHAWEIYKLPNADQSETRYNADPQALIKAVQEMRRNGTEIMAIYHSHPRWQPIPSQTDLKENHYGEVPRIIVGLLKSPPECRVWRFLNEPLRYEELTWAASDEFSVTNIASLNQAPA
jgi:proteasome lid subunit RPN8/RPN11